MGSRGPAPKSNSTDAIRLRPGVPPPPPWLDADAVAEYKRGAKELAEANATQQMDAAALATYAQAYADVARLTVEIRKEGEIVRLPNGIGAANPKVALRAQAQRQLFQAIAQLGFSPVARTRVPRGGGAKAANPFASFVK